jgi:23S rRNA-/tRNA-specific pseudouridylate synthase
MIVSSLRNQIGYHSDLVSRSKRGTFLFALLVSSSASFCTLLHPSRVGYRRRIDSRSLNSRDSLRPSLADTRMFMSSTTESLSETIRLAYAESETDGILALAASMNDADFEVDDLIDATIQAADDNKGKVASILNAFIGSCCVLPDRDVASARVVELLEAYESLAEDRGITPDIVSYSLAFQCLFQDEDSSELADHILEKAARMSKKSSGSKRRKILAASRRKQPSTCTDAEESMRDLCGADFRVLHETEDLVVINKPSGIPCFHKKLTTAGKIGKGKKKGSTGARADVSLEDALLNCNVPLSTLNPEALGLVHRLDRASSGCMVLAKSDAMHAQLLAEFFLRRTQKKYLALLQKSSGAQIPERGQITSLVDGRPAKSEFHVLEDFGGRAALVEFEIETGRKHQIRVHSAEGLASPVLLDKLYESSSEQSDEIDVLLPIKDSKHHIFLHASSLSIPGYEIHVKASSPSWWDPALDYFRQL